MRGRSVRQWWRRASTEPWRWGLLYLGAIPAFAAAYLFVDGGFHQTTTAFDAGSAGDRVRVEDMLAADIRRQLDLSHGPWIDLGAGWRARQSDIHVRQVDVSTDAVGVTLSVRAEHVERGGLEMPLRLQTPPDITARRVIPGSYGASSSWGHVDMLFVTTESARIPGLPSWEVATLLPSANDSVLVDAAWIAIDSDTAEAVERLQSAISGNPLSISGRFERMLYVSVVTITTLGFGDVVPITPAARRLVMVEAVLGVVLIGLFLNATRERFE